MSWRSKRQVRQEKKLDTRQDLHDRYEFPTISVFEGVKFGAILPTYYYFKSNSVMYIIYNFIKESGQFN